MAAAIGLVVHDCATRSVVDRIQRISRPRGRPPRREGEPPVGLNGGARAYCLNVLPAEQVGDAKAVVGRRFDRVEGGRYCVLCRMPVARGVVVLGKDARLGGYIEELVCRSLLRRKGIDALLSDPAGFVDKLAPVIECRA